MSEKRIFTSHACLIESPSLQARENAARELASAMLCSSSGSRPCGACRDCRKIKNGTHPDVIYIQRENDSGGKPRREIYVDQIRALSTDALILPNEAERKVYIIPEAEFLNVPAQNALLKLLEDPPKHVAFILCAASRESLLETIISRCERHTINADEPAPESELANEFIRAAATGKPEDLIRFCTSNEGMDTASARQFVESASALVSDMLLMRAPGAGLERKELHNLLELLDTAETYLRVNVGVKHVFGLLQAYK